MSKRYDPEKDLQRQDYDIKNEIEPYNTADIEAVLEQAFGNCTKKSRKDNGESNG